MPITYSGPYVSPTFVAGVVNNAWDKAVEIIARARTTVDDLATVGLVPETLATLSATPAFSEGLPSIPAAGTVADFEAALTSLLAAWIDEHFPDVSNPDAAAAWARIVATFTGAEQTSEMAAAASHLASLLGDYDSEVQNTVAGILSGDSTRATDGAARNQDIIDLSHRKAIDLASLDLVMRTQLEALDAARTFLADAIFGLATKEAQELQRVAASKQRLQSAYFSHLDARLQTYNVELERTALNKRVVAAADVAEKDRDVFTYRERVQAALAQLESLAHQAQGAINRVHASAGVTGGETSP